MHGTKENLLSSDRVYKAPVGFEPTSQGFADPYNRPLCQGAINIFQLESFNFLAFTFNYFWLTYLQIIFNQDDHIHVGQQTRSNLLIF